MRSCSRARGSSGSVSSDHITEVLSTELSVPAVGQGVIGIEAAPTTSRRTVSSPRWTTPTPTHDCAPSAPLRRSCRAAVTRRSRRMRKSPMAGCTWSATSVLRTAPRPTARRSEETPVTRKRSVMSSRGSCRPRVPARCSIACERRGRHAPMTLLHGWTVVVTRPAHQSAGLVAQLERGRRTRARVADADDRGPRRRVAQREQWTPDRHDWLIYTSVNAVEHALQSGARPQTARVAAIGRATARALRDRGVDVDVTPPSGADSEALLAHADFRQRQGRRILILAVTGRTRDLAHAARVARRRRRVAELYVRRPITPRQRCRRLRAAELSAAQAMVMATSVDVFAALLRPLPPELQQRLMDKVAAGARGTRRNRGARRGLAWAAGGCRQCRGRPHGRRTSSAGSPAERTSARDTIVALVVLATCRPPRCRVSCRVQCPLRSNRWSPTTLLAERGRGTSPLPVVLATIALLVAAYAQVRTGRLESDLELAQGQLAELQGTRVQLASQQAAATNQLQASLVTLRAELQASARAARAGR